MKLTVRTYQPIRPQGDKCDRCVGLNGLSATALRKDVVDYSIPFMGTFTLCPRCTTYYRNA